MHNVATPVTVHLRCSQQPHKFTKLTFPKMLIKGSATFVLVFLTHRGLYGATARPNFIVMQPDDLQFGSLWTPPAHLPGDSPFSYGDLLPNLEALRANGLQMMRAHAASPMCGTSRYSTMTGRYPSRSSLSRQRQDGVAIQDVTIPTTKLDDRTNSVIDGNDCSENNLAAVLQANQYETGMVGKWHLYNGRDEYDYANVQTEVKQCGFSSAEGVYYENLSDDWTNNGEFTHNMEYITEHAISFINNAVSNDRDFFLYFNPTAPHSSGNVYDALTSASCLDTPEGRLDSEPVVVGMSNGSDCATYRQTIIDRAGGDTSNSILGAIWVDDAVGALVQHLETIGELDNTFFLFQMDHGQEGKQSIYETGSRLAQFIHFPDEIAAGKQFGGLVSTIDIAPTILDYAGVTSSYGMDGKSWKTAVAEDDGTWNERCVVVEADTDRGVTCGCDKYLLLDTAAGDTQTITTGSRNGLVVTSGLINLCDEFGNYVTSPDETPETVMVDDEDAKTRLEEVLSCHLSMTAPSNSVTPQYGLCDDLILSGRTSAPQASPLTQAPSVPTPTILSGCTCDADADTSEHFYSEEIDASGNLVITTAGIPNHEYHIDREQPNRNNVCIQPVTITLPIAPQLRRKLRDTGMGVIGVLKTGAFMYNHLSNRNGVNDVANHPDNEQPSLDKCHGHAGGNCQYHYHEMSQLAECTNDGQWDECEHIGYLLDGFKVYSHCYHAAKARYLSSCYFMDSDADGGGGDDSSDYTHIASDDCDLDEANGFDFTGMDIRDNFGNVITGYAYVASDSYPYVMPKYAGTTWNRAESIAWPLLGSPTAAVTKSSVQARSTPFTASLGSPTLTNTPPVSMQTNPTTAQFQAEEDNRDKSGPNCFSGTNTVEVRGKGTVVMENLEVGDFVKARNGIYSKVYSLGHFDPNGEATFLAITVQGSSAKSTSILEITADHIVFVKSRPNGEPTASTASDVKVGDLLISESDDFNVTNKVVQIDSIQRRGLYAPVTNDGTVEVSGVLASSYVVLSPDVSPALQHTFFHSICFPIRTLCTISFDTFCGSESHDAEGISEHFSELIAVGKLMRKYTSSGVQSTVLHFLNLFVGRWLLVGALAVLVWLLRGRHLHDHGAELETPLLLS